MPLPPNHHRRRHYAVQQRLLNVLTIAREISGRSSNALRNVLNQSPNHRAERRERLDQRSLFATVEIGLVIRTSNRGHLFEFPSVLGPQSGYKGPPAIRFELS